MTFTDGLTYSQVITFLKGAKLDHTVLTAVEQARVREYERKLPTTIAAQHGVKNAKKKLDRLEARLK